MRTEIGNVIFETKNDTKWDNVPVCSPERLDLAYKQLHQFVPGVENVERIIKVLRRHGIEPYEQVQQQQQQHEREFGTTIATKLNSKFKDVVIITNSATVVASGLMLLVGFAYLYDLRVFYFSTRKHAQIINPKGTTPVAILHHVDSYLGSKTKWFDLKNVPNYRPPKVLKYLPGPAPPPPSSTAATNKEETQKSIQTRNKISFTRDDIINFFLNAIRYKLRAIISDGLANIKTVQKALSTLDNLQKDHNKRKTLPKGILDLIQNNILREYPHLHVALSWFADRIKEYKDYNRVGVYKEEGNHLIEEVRQYLKIKEWDDVFGEYKNEQIDSGSGSSGSSSSSSAQKIIEEDDEYSEDDEDDNNNNKKNNKPVKITETITFSLRSILREELDYTDYLKRITKEQERVARCFVQLSNATKVLTELIVKGEAANVCGVEVQQNTFDFKKLAGNFDFGTYSNKDSPTRIQVSSIPKHEDLPKLDLVYSFAHFSNLLSGCVGSSVRESKEEQVFKTLREMITRTGTTTKQDDFAFTGAINNALREYFINAKNLWTRKRHDRDLRVLSTLLLRAMLAPQRLYSYLEKRNKLSKEKKEKKEKKEQKGDVVRLFTKKHVIGMRNHYIKELEWAIARGRKIDIINKLFTKLEEWQEKLGKINSETRTKEPDTVDENLPDNQIENQLKKSNPLNLHENDEEQEEIEEATLNTNETSTRKIRALVSIIKRLLDKGSEGVNSETIKDTAFKGTNLNDHECQVAGQVYDAIAPYYFAKTEEKEEEENDDDEDDEDKKEVITIHQCAPLAFITNTAVALFGPQQNQWAVYPSVHQEDHSIHISSDVLYMLFSKDFTIPSSSSPGCITSKRQASRPEHKREVFGSFFNIPKITQAMKTRKLYFGDRITFVNKHVLRVLGTRIVVKQEKNIDEKGDGSDSDDETMADATKQDSQRRVQKPLSRKGKGRAGKGQAGKGKSAKARKKGKKKVQRKRKRGKGYEEQRQQPRKKRQVDSSSSTEEDPQIENLTQRINSFTNQLAQLLKKQKPLEIKRSALNRECTKKKKEKIFDYDLYAQLKSTRNEIRTVERDIVATRRNIADLRSKRYMLQSRTAKISTKDQYKDEQLIKIQQGLFKSLTKNRSLQINGIDPGHVVAATAVSTTLTYVFDLVKEYTGGLIKPSSSATTSSSATMPSSSSSSTTTICSSSKIPAETTATIPFKGPMLSPPMKYNAKTKNWVTFASKHEKRRELFKMQNSDNNKTDLDRRRKESKTREIRHRIYHKKLANSWSSEDSSTIHFFGSWRSGRKGFKKHQQGACAKLKKELDAPEHNHIKITDKYGTSKTCPFCHEPLMLHKYRKYGKLQSVNGALRCTNPSCSSKGRNTLNRDAVGGLNISVNGVTRAISLDNRPIPPFSRSSSPSYALSPAFKQFIA
ncbi:hypothetical protein BDC45DRAFT_534089 [Circinella umbellata]|nr:hypothetical protein BDC45DRAFT_534089 [Circinella umbellata]